MKEWIESLPSVPRFFVETGLITLGTVIVVGIISLIAGWRDVVSISNALFYAASILFLGALVIYFGTRSNRPSWRERARIERQGEKAEVGQPTDDQQGLPEPVEQETKDTPISSYANKLLLAGVIVFGLSILVTVI